jgi:hypothetical protein
VPDGLYILRCQHFGGRGGGRLEGFYCITNIILYRSWKGAEVVSFLEEHLNIESDSLEPHSETSEYLILYVGNIRQPASNKLILE